MPPSRFVSLMKAGEAPLTMKPRASKSNATDRPPAEPEAPQPPKNAGAPADPTIVLTPEQMGGQDDGERVRQEIQVKTLACLNRPQRERLKRFRLAWRKYWPLLPMLLFTWLLGSVCLMPRYVAAPEEVASSENTAAIQATTELDADAHDELAKPSSTELRTDPHLIYRQPKVTWSDFTRKHLRNALGNHAFYVATAILLVFLLAYGIIVYLTRLEYDIGIKRFALLSLLLGLEFVSVAICANYIAAAYQVHLALLLSCLPLAFFPAIICNLLDERLAVITATLMAMLLPLQLNLPNEHFPLFYFALMVTLAAVLFFRGITRRMEFFTQGLIYGLVLAGAETLFLLGEAAMPARKELALEIAILLLGALANGMLNGILCILCMSVLEVIFRLPTALSLTEISNLDAPLLERLRLEAPGTYEHSIAVADLAVSGARVIHANAKLAYAMALYHDIGKLFSPKHFTENLLDGEPSPHQRHAPENSCEYLREHARFGIHLARKYHLPNLLYPAILQHHGDTIMAAFYHQACRLAAEKGMPQPNQRDFRYDQERPASREVALIMLADSCEAATRALTHPKRDCKGEAAKLADAEELFRKSHPDATPQELAAYYEQLLKDAEKTAQESFRQQLTERVKSVIQGKFNDGQFDHVDFSTRQLAELADTFVATLLDKNHTRLEYKK